MRKQNTFVTLFPEAERVHLNKDVGQIPLVMSRNFGFSSFLVTEKHVQLDEIEYDAQFLRIITVPRLPKVFGINLSSVLYVARNARRIDVLNLYHVTLNTKILCLIQRALNPAGKIYVKLDLNVQNEKKAASTERARKKGFLSPLLAWANSKFYSAASVFSAESVEGARLAAARYPAMKNKLITIANGVDVEGVLRKVETLPFSEKENLIISVGRIGATEKNNELLLQALSQINLGTWKAAFVGPYTLGFKAALDRLLLQRPDLADRVQLVGNVSKRSELMGWYNKAKVFALTSRSEGFPLVFPEALMFGNYIVSTDVSSLKEITDDWRFGEVIELDDGTSLAAALQRIIDEGRCSESRHSETVAYARTKYDWAHVLEKLADRLALRNNHA